LVKNIDLISSDSLPTLGVVNEDRQQCPIVTSPKQSTQLVIDHETLTDNITTTNWSTLGKIFIFILLYFML